MRSAFTGLILAAGVLGGATDAAAQSAIMKLPDLSQHARVMQRIGLTDIIVDYSRPLVRGRKIFGGVLAYGEVWRAGANNNTTFEVSDPVTIDGLPLPKGVYGLHMIPGQTSWVVIFSRNSTSWGSFNYEQSEDVLRVTVTPGPSDFHEALSYDFGEPQPNSTVATLRWEKVAVPFKIEVNTLELTQKSLTVHLRPR